MHSREEVSELDVAIEHWEAFVGRRDNYQKNSARVALAVAYWRESENHFYHKRWFRGWFASYQASYWAQEALSVAATFYDREYRGNGREGLIMAQDQIDAIAMVLSRPWYLCGNRPLAANLFGGTKTAESVLEFQ